VDAQAFNDSCAEYFELMVALVKFPYALDGFDVIDVLMSLASGIKDRGETETSEDDDDCFLQGHLSLLRALLVSLPADQGRQGVLLVQSTASLIEELCQNCLFPITEVSANGQYSVPKPKCKSQDSRVYAFYLLLEIVENNSEYYLKVLSFLSSLYSLNDIDTSSSAAPLSSKYLLSKSRIGYAGLGMYKYSLSYDIICYNIVIGY
jgi:hypothetical protein